MVAHSSGRKIRKCIGYKDKLKIIEDVKLGKPILNI